nr:MAG TPA: hypothetical protein [Caudoviricetes sp.]
MNKHRCIASNIICILLRLDILLAIYYNNAITERETPQEATP